MISANDRLFHHVRAAIAQHLRQLSGTEKPTYKFSPESPCRITVTVNPPTKRAMDSPNWYPTVKALLDGLTDAGQWTDDNDKVIKEVAFRPGELSNIKQCYRLDIRIEPWECD